MKERLSLLAQKLTKPVLAPRLEAGAIFMANPNTEPSSPVSHRVEQRRSVDKQVNISPERRKEIGEAWKAEYLKRHGIEDIPRLPQEERRVIQDAIDRGESPIGIGGGAAELSSEGITDQQILDQVITANALLAGAPDGDWLDQIDTLQKTLDRLAFIPTADQAQKREMQRRITDRLVELKGQTRTSAEQNKETQEEGQYGSTRQRKAEVLDKEKDMGREGLNPAKYPDPSIQPILQEIRGKIEQNEAGHEYLKSKIEQLKLLRDAGTNQEGVQTASGEQAQEFLIEAIKLKNLLTARSREQRASKVSDWSSYGEMRMLIDEKWELIERAIRARARNPNISEKEWKDGEKDRKDAENEIERDFNQLFASADVRSNDQWQEALGTARSIEVDDFINALTAVASGKFTFQGRVLEDWEREGIESIVRQLVEEEKLREYLHSISYYVNQSASAEEIHKVSKSFRAEQAELAYKTKGVALAGHLYEQAMYQVMAKHGGYLPYEAMINTLDGKYGEVEQLVWENMNKAKEMGILPKDTDSWELKRAISLARGMGIMRGRTIEIVALSGIPKGRSLVSWWANDIVKKLTFYKQILRFNVGDQRNRILAYLKSKKSRAWSTKELEGYTLEQSFDKFVNESLDGDTDREIDSENPGEGGSIETQTGWRWGVDKVNLAGALSHILAEDPYSPIIGIGLWIEKERKNLSILAERHTKLDSPEVVFGQTVSTVGEKAEVIIRKNLELAAKITPLKLFNNLRSLRQAVLRGSTSIYGETAVREDADAKGQILIKSKLLEDDLSKLALVQERLTRNRTEEYKKYLDARDEYDRKKQEGEQVEGERPTPPNMFSDEFTRLDFSGLEPVEVDRIQRLAQLIRGEFDANYREPFIENLKDRPWKVPFVFGTDDMPYELYNYTKTGHNSFERRWGDNVSIAQASDLFVKFIDNMASFENQGQIVKSLDEIYRTLKGHDQDVAKRFMTGIIEGIIKFYKKDWVTRLPAGVGTLNTLAKGGRSSYAEIAFGPGQMGWDELDCKIFLKHIERAGLVNEEQLEYLTTRVGAEPWNIGLAIFRTAVPLSLFALLYYLFSEEVEDIGKAA